MRDNDSAVSPVVGVMLMLVVTIIIAAVVSGFAGGMVDSQSKIPQATIQGEMSVTSGLKIIHAGGEAIPTADMVITVKNGPAFGANIEAMSTNVVNLTTVRNSAGDPVLYVNDEGAIDGYNITAFSPGDTLFVSIADCDPNKLQPTVAAFPKNGVSSYSFDGNEWTWVGGEKKIQFWKLNFVNPDNIGKTFYLDVTDKKSGTLISRAVVRITG